MPLTNNPPDRAELVRTRPVSGLPTIETVRTRTGGSRPTSSLFSLDGISIGDVLGKYELVAEIGRGSTSRVYLGRHIRLLFHVAVKILEPAVIAESPELIQQLEAEAILLAKLNHPNVVRLWDLDDEISVPYLVMEYVAGGTFAELINLHGALPPNFAWAVIRQAVEGLAEAHKHGVIHRDVKPGNLLITDEGIAKVADLGLALVKCGAPKEQPESPSRDCMIAGTVAFVSPEQAKRPDECDVRSDIYSLGATLYQAVTGRFVFEGRSSVEVIIKHMNEPPPDPRKYAPDLSPACAAVIQRMLAKDPADRYQTYDELKVALAQAIGDRRAPRPLSESFLKFGQ